MTTPNTQSGVSRFLIGYGWDEVEVIEVPSLGAAVAKAIQLSIKAGVEPEGMCDHAWARPYSAAIAYELGWGADEDTHSAMRCDPRAFQRW